MSTHDAAHLFSPPRPARWPRELRSANTWLPLVTKEDDEGEGGRPAVEVFCTSEVQTLRSAPHLLRFGTCCVFGTPSRDLGCERAADHRGGRCPGTCGGRGWERGRTCQPSPPAAVTITPSASRQPSRGARSGRWWGDFLSARDRPDFFSLPTWCLQELLRRLGWLGDLQSGTPARAMQAPPVAPEASLGSGSGPSNLGCNHSRRGHRSL